MAGTVKKLQFEKSSYYFIVLLLLAFAGFWKSYFSKFFDGTNDFSFYFHFHTLLVLSWIVLLILQPILIRKKKFQLHRKIGKIAYLLMPLLLLSVVFILNFRMKKTPAEELTFINFLVVFKDLAMLTLAFSIAMYHRHKVNLHARAMIVTGIVFLEPAVARIYGMGALILILGTLVTLIILERKQKNGRWIFPMFLGIYIVVYSMLIFEIPVPFLDPLVKGFAKLPLT